MMATANFPHGTNQDMMVLNLNIKQKFLFFSFNATHYKKKTIHDTKKNLNLNLEGFLMINFHCIEQKIII
jgi:hypothetical protein